MRVAIYGTGGHAKVVWDILITLGHTVVCFVSEVAASERYLGLPVIFTGAVPPRVDGVIVAIGDNQIRKRIFEGLKAQGVPFINAIHPSAHVLGGARLGLGVVVACAAVIGVSAVIGDNALINTAATVDHDNQIGAHAHIAPGCHLAGNVTLEEGAFLGTGALVIPRIRVGAWATVGAGTVLIRDVGAYEKVAGNPGRSLSSSAESDPPPFG